MFFLCQVRKGFVKYIPIVGGIPDSLSCYPDSKAQKSRLLKQNFPDSGKRIPLHERFQREAKCKTFLVNVTFHKFSLYSYRCKAALFIFSFVH